MVIGSKELIRKINYTLVLETLLQRSPISRASLSKELGLTKATISTIVQELIDKNLVFEVGRDHTELGRKPILLTFNKDAGFALCIDITRDTCTTILSNLLAETVRSDVLPSPKTPSDLPDVLSSYIRTILLHLPTTRYGLVGITLSIHGVTDKNSIRFTPSYNLTGRNIAKDLEEEFGIPVFLENEANLSAIAENTFVYDSATLASIHVYDEIRLGVMMNGTLVKGYHGYSSEIGHTIFHIDGRPCPCGNHGCLNQYLSEPVLLHDFATRKHLTHISFDEFLEYYQKEDPDAKEITNIFIKYMSALLNNLLNSINPEIVIINSTFTSKIPGLTDEISSSLTSKMNHFKSIQTSSLHGKSSLLGGLCMTIRNFLNIKHLRLQTHNRKKEA